MEKIFSKSMLKLNNKNIAIIGSSPIMMLFAKTLSRRNTITVFEKKKIGGAWLYEDIVQIKTNLFTNVLVPSNSTNQKKIKRVNSFLKKFKVNINHNKDTYKTVSSYKPTTVYKYDFSLFYSNILKSNKINFKKINIKYLVEKKNFVLINKKFKYDLVLVPFFNSLDQIDLLNKKILIPFKKIISKHIVLVTKKPLIKNFYYSEQGDNYFDRIQIKKIKNFYFLTARIAKNFKKKSKSFFIKNFSLLNNVELYYSNINSYINYYRNKEQIKKIKKANSKKIKIMNTTQLYGSIIKYFF